MKVIDFRFRPNTPEIINGIKNSTMFRLPVKSSASTSASPSPWTRSWPTSTPWAWNWA